MSFSEDVRKELSHDKTERKCCVSAEMATALIATGGLSYKGPGRYGLTVYADSMETARRYLVMFKKFYHIDCALRAVESNRLGGQTRYAVTPGERDVPGLLRALDLLDEERPFGLAVAPNGQLVKKDCCRVAFLRAAYLAGGSMDNPENSYHLEIATGDETLARMISEVLTQMGIPARLTARKSQQVVYLKDSEQIVTLLAMLGANKAVLALENVRILKGLRNEANRAANCDANNVDKTVAAAEKQLSIIEAIDRHMGLQNLPEPLRDIAELRRLYPDASLTELGQMATPALGKSGVNARMRRLEAIAEELVNE